MVTTNDDAVADRARLIRAHGMRVRYYHEMMGYNFRMTNIHAAIGNAQLPKLERFNEARIANAAYLSERLDPEKVLVPQVRPGTRHVFHQYTVRVLPPLDRDDVRRQLAEKGVGSEIYYPVPVHRQQIYLDLGYGDQSFPESECAARQVLSLPIHPGLTREDLDTIAAAVNSLTAS
jgi:perosamine synthetase